MEFELLSYLLLNCYFKISSASERSGLALSIAVQREYIYHFDRELDMCDGKDIRNCELN